MVSKFLISQWETKNYLAHYYLSSKLVYDEVLIFKYIYKFLSRFKKHSFDDFLDFGSGPTIHRLIPFVNHAKNIYISDYLAENLEEIKLWLNDRQTAHDWDEQIKHILKIEYGNQKESSDDLIREVNHRKLALKKKIKGFLKCDAFKQKPLLGFNKRFDLITSFYCIDSITSSKVKWYKATKNLLELAKPGGWVIISALRSTKHYMVDSSIFPSPEINEKDFLKVFVQSKFDIKSVNVKIISAKLWLNSEIKSLMIISAQKLKAL